MRDLWRCSGCLGLLALVMLTWPVEARPNDNNEYEVLWVEKSLNILQHAKRKAVCQRQGWSVCPASVGGGCCPENFACDKASCYATTAGPTSTCNGKPGWYACGLTAGPGSCCPVGLICDSGNACVPPPGVSLSMSCPASYSNCPVSLGGGCCKNGMACGSGICYDTPKTLPVSETKTTTDSRGHATITVVTSMTVITEGLDPTSGSAAPSKIPQLIPSTVAKMDSIQTNESGGGHGGLSSGALGGIVAGVIVILVVIVVAATLIVLRLKKAEQAAKLAEAVAESKRGSSNSPPRSHKAGFGQPSVSEITTATDVDPVNQFPIMRPSPDLRSRSATVVTGDRSPSHTPNFTNSGASSPPIWGMPFNYVPSEGSDGRQSSLDSYPHHDNSNSNSRMSQRVSVDSHGPHGHSRQTSDTSELEEQHGVSELDTAEKNEAESRRRSNSATRPVKGHVRRNSDLSVHSRSRGDSNAATGALGTVSEIYELHGHYGPLHTASGQTAARLGRGPSSVSEASSHQDT